MGLDIYVQRIVKTPTDKDYYIRLIDDEGNYENKFPSWTKEFEQSITEHWYDWDKYKTQTGIYLNQYDWGGEEYSDRGNFMQIYPKGEEQTNKNTIEIDLDKVPTYDKTIKVLYYDEVGYQRKGLNDKFYEDYRNGKIGYYVWSKAELERYKQDYCNKPYEYTYPNGEKSGNMCYPKEDFQKNILNKFIEGEDVVAFSW